MKETIKETVLNKLHLIYGDVIDERIANRLYKEIETLEKIDKLSEIEVVVDIINKNKNEGDLIVPCLSLPNSFLLYLLGINNVNPLPRHTYCPKCHSFSWGENKGDICPYCGDTLIKDGYDLDYELFIKDFEKPNHYCFYTSNKNEDNSYVRLTSSMELKLAKELGLNQHDIDALPKDKDEILRYIDRPLFEDKYKKIHLIHHSPFIGLSDIGNPIIEELCKKYQTYSFNDLVKIISMYHSTGVIDANNNEFDNLNDFITSRDDLYAFLKGNQFNSDDAYKICKEVRANGEGHLSYSSEEKLKESLVDEKYISLIKEIRYIFHKGHIISHLSLLVVLAKIYLNEPRRYYRAYFNINKDIYNLIDKDEDLINSLIKSKSTELEKIYLGLIDLKERM